MKITIDKPVSDPLFLAKVANYAGGFIVSQKAIEGKGEDWFKTNPVGTGAFQFETYEPRQKVVLAGHAKYFRGAPVLKKVTARFMPGVSSREFGLQHRRAAHHRGPEGRQVDREGRDLQGRESPDLRPLRRRRCCSST